ncbi:MAG: hypothetical protein CMO04_19445 [Thalassospira sp.]|nr:hypothetical protein [Thalassospira sp.]
MCKCIWLLAAMTWRWPNWIGDRHLSDRAGWIGPAPGLVICQKCCCCGRLSVFSDRGKGTFDAKSDGFLRAAN